MKPDDTAPRIIGSHERRPALFAGAALLLMALLAGIAYGGIHGNLVVPGDEAATAANIHGHKVLWAFGIFTWGLIALLDALVAFWLYRVFRETHRGLSRAAMVARLVYTGVLLVAVAALFGAFSQGQALAWVMLFQRIWYAGLILFGIHLTLLALLSLRTGFIHGVFTILLFVAGPAYFVIHILFLIGGEAGDWGHRLQSVMMVPMTLAELGLALWLIFISVRNERKGNISYSSADSFGTL